MSKFTRRTFLKGMGAITAGTVLPFGRNLAFAQSSCEMNKKILVVINMAGGVHSLSVLPPLQLQEYLDRHPDVGIRNALTLNSSIGLNPAMANFANFYSGGMPGVGISLFNQVGFLNQTGADVTSRSHEVGTQQYAAGLTNPYGSISSGWIGRFAKTYCVGSQSAYNIVNLGGFGRALNEVDVPVVSAASLAGMSYTNDGTSVANNKYVRDTIQEFNNSAPGALHGQLYEQSNRTADSAVAMLGQVRSAYSAAPAGLYVNGNPLNQRFMDAAALINSWDLTKVSVIAMAQGGYDTHGAQGTAAPLVTGAYMGLARLLQQLDQAIGSFYQDLKNRNLHQNVSVLVVSEFGRTFQNENRTPEGAPSPGTDHGTGGFAALIGPGVRSQVAYSNLLPSYFTGTKNWLGAEVDIRSVYAAVLERHLGVDSAPIFPEAYIRANIPIYA